MFSIWFAVSRDRGSVHPEQREWPCQAPYPGTTLSISASSRQRFELSVSICALSRFVLYILGKMYFKGVASLLYTISAYKWFHRKALLSDSGGNLYLKLSFNLSFFKLTGFYIVFPNKFKLHNA